MKCIFFKRLLEDIKRYVIIETVLSVLSIFSICAAVYTIIKDKWPESTVLVMIILLLSIILISILYLLNKKYKEIDDLLFENENYKKEEEKKEEYGQIILDHNKFNNYERIRNAEKRIILHAAFYPNYKTPPYSTAIDELLANQNKLNVKITVIITHPNVEWANEFQKILRKEFNDIEKDFKAAIWASSNFFLDKKRKYNDRIEIIFSERLPLFPVVIIDNELFIGHYCHAITPAPEGFWFYIKNDVIPKLIDYIFCGLNVPEFNPNSSSDPKLNALARYIEDINDAITNGKKIENKEDLITEMNPNNPNENTEEIQNNQNM